MLSVMDRAWNQFSFTDIFDVGHGFYNKKPPMHTDGNLPFIGASGMNNGVTGFTTVDDVRRCSKIGYGSNEPIEKKLFDSGTLCVVNNGKPGYAYYQPHVYTCTHDVNPLKLKSGTMSEALGLFLAQAIKAQGVCFEYARKWRPSRMVRSKLMLPVNDGGEPDWQFMEDYVREREDAQLERCRDFLKRRLAEIERERERESRSAASESQ